MNTIKTIALSIIAIATLATISATASAEPTKQTKADRDTTIEVTETPKKERAEPKPVHLAPPGRMHHGHMDYTVSDNARVGVDIPVSVALNN